ncbi:helix-turn-helix transcriptional regulator [Streptomyces sp. NPDC005373]|uniref:helix-turn-helix domain-containing protein n=1 Tax=Streptomyces sp. NPDC005373 TaxID=3156879 RepID=UPI0033A7CFDC
MNSTPSSAAQAARAQVAARLLDVRRSAGLKAVELAATCGWHKSKVSRLENARMLPSDADIRAWCTACRAPDQVSDLIAKTRDADLLYVEWKRLHRDGIRRMQESAVPLYEGTSVFRVYCHNVVPGLSQVHGYAEALMNLISDFQGTPNDSPEAATARLERSRVIYEGQHRFVLIIEQAVLGYRFGTPSVMAGQLGYLLEVMSLPTVAFGIVPQPAERTMWPLETFMIFDNSRVQVETLTAEINITAPDEIAAYSRAFDRLRDMAVFGPKARTLILEEIAALG